MTITKLCKALEKELDKQFPKGDKARGRALVLFAIAQIEIDKAKETAKKQFKRLNKMIKKYDSNWYYSQLKKEYGNEILYLLEDIVKDLKEIKNDKEK